jgi:hypothetical protein
MPDLATNVFYYGDNLDILRRYLPDAAVDLVYLDPPLRSNRDYNVIFRDESGNATDAQLLAFEDTWHWGPSAEATYAYLTNTARHEGRVPDRSPSSPPCAEAPRMDGLERLRPLSIVGLGGRAG